MIDPQMHTKPLSLLVAEDSEMDRMFLKEAFDELGFDVELQFVGDGEELLAHLLKGSTDSGLFPDSLPAIVLLDINMPRLNGIMAIKLLRKIPHLNVVPVIILTSSTEPAYIAQAYANGANAYLQKPQRIEDLIDTVRRFGDFWLGGVKLPNPRFNLE